MARHPDYRLGGPVYLSGVAGGHGSPAGLARRCCGGARPARRAPRHCPRLRGRYLAPIPHLFVVGLEWAQSVRPAARGSVAAAGAAAAVAAAVLCPEWRDAAVGCRSGRVGAAAAPVTAGGGAARHGGVFDPRAFAWPTGLA